MLLVLKVQNIFAGVLNALTPNARIVPAVRHEDMSRDAREIEAYQNDPLCTTGNLRVSVGYHGMKRMKMLVPSAKEFTLPLLVLHGTADKCTSPAAAEAFCASVASEDKTFHPFEGLFHMLFHEPERAQVMATLGDWLAAHV